MVCDYTSPLSHRQIEVTKSVLEDLGCGGIPVITVYNKTDLAPSHSLPQSNNRTVFISAKEKTGIDSLLKAISDALSFHMQELWLLIPYSQAAILDELRQNGTVYAESYQEEGILVHSLTDKRLLYKLRPFLTD